MAISHQSSSRSYLTLRGTSNNKVEDVLGLPGQPNFRGKAARIYNKSGVGPNAC